MNTRLGELMAKVIGRTQDPLAPVKMQQAYMGLEALGKMMATATSKEEVERMSERLLSDFPAQMDKESVDPAFICALCALLQQSLVGYGSQPL